MAAYSCLNANIPNKLIYGNISLGKEMATFKSLSSPTSSLYNNDEGFFCFIFNDKYKLPVLFKTQELVIRKE